MYWHLFCHATGMRNKKAVFAIFMLACGCGSDEEASVVAGFASNSTSVVLGCPVYASTNLQHRVIGSGSLVSGGETDVVTAELGWTNVVTLRVYAGSSDGAFAYSSQIQVSGIGVYPFAVIADANADGRNDIVLCDPGAGTTPGKILLLAQNADGTFTESSLVGSAWPVDAETADYDGDLIREVYVLASDQKLYRVEAGVTDLLTLSQPYRYLASGTFSSGAGRVLSAAVSASDSVDLLQVDAGSVSVWMSTILPGEAVAGLQSAEFNGDSWTDLAVAVSVASVYHVKALRNDATSFTLLRACGLGGILHDFAAADVSGDGKADVFASEAVGGRDYVAVSYSNAAGSLDASVRLIEGYWPTVLSGQFDGIGAQDLLFSGKYFFKGGQNPEAVRQYDLGDGPSAVAVGDFNGDLRADLAAFLSSSGELSVSLGTGVLQFGAPAKTQVNIWNPSRAAVGRFDADANLDLAVLDGSDLYVLAGNGTGGFAAPQWIGTAEDFTTLDVQIDGRLEIAYTDPSQNRVRIYANGTTTNITVLDWPRGIATGDFNADGLPDLVVGRLYLNAVQLLMNGGGFTAGAMITLPGQPWALATGDFNGDGYRDIAAGDSASRFWLVRGAVGGAFGTPEEFSSGFLDAIGASDLDGDGRAELIVLDSDQSLVTVFIGHAATPLQSSKLYPAAVNSSSLTVADADADGDMDVTVGNAAQSGSDRVLLWRNLSGGLD